MYLFQLLLFISDQINAQTLFQTQKINQAACDLAKGVAREGGAYFAGCICQTAFLYQQGAGKDVVMKKFREQIEIFIQNDADILIGEVRFLTKSHFKTKVKGERHMNLPISLRVPCSRVEEHSNGNRKVGVSRGLIFFFVPRW